MLHRYQINSDKWGTWTLFFDAQGHWMVESGHRSMRTVMTLAQFEETVVGQQMATGIAEAIEKAQNDV